MPPTLGILLAAAFTVVSAIAAGRLFLSLVRCRLNGAERALFSFAAGAALLSVAVFTLAAMRIARWETFLMLGMDLIAAALWRCGWKMGRSEFPALARLPVLLFLIPFSIFSLLYLVQATAPEISPDGSTYHLGLVARYLREGGFRTVPNSMYGYLSQGLEMLFLFAFAFGRHSAAALIHCAFLLALPWAMILYARRFGFPVPGLGAALLVYLSPVVGMDGASAYNDVAAAFAVFAVFYLLEMWTESLDAGLLAPLGLMAGFAFAIKYTAFLALPFALVMVGVRLRRDWRRLVRAKLVVAGMAFLMMVPWLGKNLVTVGNPVAPFFNRWFPNPHVFIEFEKTYSAHLRRYRLTGWRQWPMEATTRGRILEGFVGPVFLLAPLALLALRDRRGRRLLLAGGVFALTYPSNVGARFLIPLLPFVSLAMARALDGRGRILLALAWLHAVLSWPPNMRWYADRYAWRIPRFPIRAALRLEAEHDYLNFRLGTYPVARMIEEKVPPGGKVLGINNVPEAYTTREYLTAYQFARGNTLQQVLWSPVAEHYKPAGRFRFRFAPGRFTAMRIVQTGSGLPDWGVNEFRFYDRDRELPREPWWRLRASPNPWDVQFAFDNAVVTPWRAREATYPGMFVQADFGRAEPLDSALIECACDIEKTAMRLEGRNEAGAWRVLSDNPQRWQAEMPAGLRRQATAEIKAQGIDYLVIFDTDFHADDMRYLSPLWGLRLLGERRGARLYFIE